MRPAIIIVSYNGRRWLPPALTSCAQFALGATVYVVDNASTDGSAELVAQAFPGAKLIRESKNLGFAGGNNVGIKAALADGAEALFLLNQDAELTAGALAALTQYLEQHPRVAAVQPALYLPDGRVNSLGNSYHYLGFGESGGNGLSLEQARRTLPWLVDHSEPPYLSGAAVLVRAAALTPVGLFDEELFVYHEDLELCLRLRLAGWQLALEPAARVIHHYDHQRSLAQLYYMERNRFLVWLSYFKVPTLVLLALPALLAELLMLVAAAMHGWLLPKLRAYAYFFQPSSWRGLLVRRRRLAALRTVTDRALLSHASATIASAQASPKLLHAFANALGATGWRLIFPLIRW